MGLFGRKIAAEEFGKVMAHAYSKRCKQAVELIQAEYDTEELDPGTLEEEVSALQYFAFDFGIAAGKEENKRDRIRDAFLRALQMPQPVAAHMAERMEEYVQAFKSTDDQTARMFQIGNTFAEYAGAEGDPLLGNMAATTFVYSFELANRQVEEALPDLK